MLCRCFRGETKCHDPIVVWLLRRQDVSQHWAGEGACCVSEGMCSAPHPATFGGSSPSVTAPSPCPALPFPPTMLPPVLCWHHSIVLRGAWELLQLKNDFAQRWAIFPPSAAVLVTICCTNEGWQKGAEAHAGGGVERKCRLTV